MHHPAASPAPTVSLRLSPIRKSGLTVLFGLILASGSTAWAASGNPPALHSGAVAGFVSTSGEKSALRYAYATTIAATDDDKKSESADTDEPSEDAVEISAPSSDPDQHAAAVSAIAVVLSNQPLSSAELASIAENTWAGNAKMQGALILANPAKENDFDVRLLGAAGIQELFGMTSTGGEVSIGTDERITGAVAMTNQAAMGLSELQAGFDIPLDAAAREGAHDCGSAAMLRAFQRILPSRWRLESDDAPGPERTGRLVIDRRIAPDQFAGTLIINVKKPQIEVREEFTFTCANGAVHMHGAVAPGSPWSPDRMELMIESRRLIGTGSDAKGSSFTMSFSK